MTAPVRLDVFSDYLCPWCYNAAARLREVREAYGDRVSLHWRTFPLIPGEQPDRRVTQKTRDGWQRIGAEEPRTRFVPPAVDAPLPSSSIPALTAAKCAERQGEEAFARFHERLFTAHFRDHLDIGRAAVLRELARESALDLARFAADASEAYEAVLRDCAEGAAWFGVSALPTVILNERLSLVGAVPTERYRALIEWILAGEPGGVIPLAEAGPPAGASSAAAGSSLAPAPLDPRLSSGEPGGESAGRADALPADG